MDKRRPFMLLRARPKPASAERFDQWFRGQQLDHLRRVPGIQHVRTGRTVGGVRLGLYLFADPEAVQPGLASPEAAFARGAWGEWTGQLDELRIEIWAGAFPLPIYQSAN